jgi:hypothetical protein
MGAFNSTEFAWKDITITAMGQTFEAAMEIEYDVEVEKKQTYGRGGKVRGIQTGNESPKGNLTCKQSLLEAMIRTAQDNGGKGAKLTDISFDIQVHYLKGTDLVKDRIVGAEFTKQPKQMKQGDTEMSVKLPFLAMDINYNID